MRAFLLFIVLICSFRLLYADESGMSWTEAVETLKKNNSDYLAADLTYKSAQASEWSSSSGYLPSFFGQMSYNKTRVNESEDNSNQYSASLTLSQNLFAGLKDYYKTSQAQAQTRGALSKFQIAKSQISYDFVAAYQAVLTAVEYLKLSESIVRRRDDDLRLVELRFESGRENKGSVLLSAAYLAQARYEKLQAQHQLETAQITLSHFLGINRQQIGSLRDGVPLQDPPENQNFEDLSLASPQYQESLANVDANIAAVGVARSAFFPTVNLTGSLGKSGPEYFPSQDHRWSIGASLTIPLFDGGRDVSTTRSASYSRDSSLQHRRSVEQSQIESLQLSHQKFTQSVEKLKVDESFQKAATVRAEIARSQYNNGLISFTDWDSIENDLITRQKTYLQSKKERVLNQAAWQQARGEGVLP